MPDTLVYIGYAVTVIVVVALSFKLGKYVDIIDAKSKISGAFIGGVMLAAVTSLPELFTSLSSVWIVRESSLVIGNILGSDLINLAFFGVILLVFTRGMRKAKFSRYYITSLLVGLLLYGLVAVGMFLDDYMRLGWYSVTSPIILAAYIMLVYKMPKTAEEEGFPELAAKFRCVAAIEDRCHQILDMRGRAYRRFYTYDVPNGYRGGQARTRQDICRRAVPRRRDEPARADIVGDAVLSRQLQRRGR